MRAGDGGDDCERAVTTGHPERISAVGHGLIDQHPEVLVARKLDDLDALLPTALGDARTRGSAPTRPRVDEENGRAADRPLPSRSATTASCRARVSALGQAG